MRLAEPLAPNVESSRARSVLKRFVRLAVQVARQHRLVRHLARGFQGDADPRSTDVAADDRFDVWMPHAENGLLEAHRSLMAGLLAEPGRCDTPVEAS